MKIRAFILALAVIAALSGAALADKAAALYVGGAEFTRDELSVDRSGEGWRWEASSGRLTLDNYSAGFISSYMDELALALADGSENRVGAPEQSLYSLFSAGPLDISGSGTILSGAPIYAMGDISVTDSTLRLTGGLSCDGSVSAEGARIYLDGGGLSAGAYDGIELKDTVLDASGASAGASARTMSVTGGSVTVKDCATGLQCEPVSGYQGLLSLSNALLRIDNCTTGISQSSGHGSMSNTRLEATGCDIEIMRIKYNAIKVERDVYFKNCSVRLENESYYPALYINDFGTTQLDGGCKFVVRGTGSGFVKGVSVTATDELDVMCVGGAIDPGVLTLPDGQIVSASNNRLLVKNGRVEENRSTVTKLIAGGEKKLLDDLLGDLSGKGWSWSAKEQTLTLDGHDGEFVELAGNAATLKIAGNSVVRDELTLPEGSIITGGSKLTVEDMTKGADITFDGPALTSEHVNTAGFTLKSGGVTVRGSNEFGALVMEGGTLYTAGSVMTSSAALAGGAIKNVEAGGTMELRASLGDINITGGEFDFSPLTRSHGLTADEGVISIGGTAHVTVRGGESAFKAKKVLIGGKVYTGDDGVEVQSGVIVRTFKDRIVLKVGEKAIDAGEWKSDISGEGWNWNGKTRTLTLDNAELTVASYNKDISVRLASGSVNKSSVDFMQGGTLLGPGKLIWFGDIYSEGNLVIKEGAVIDCNRIGTMGNLTVKDSVIACKNVYAKKNITLKNSSVKIETRLMADFGSVSLNNSIVVSPETYEHLEEATYGDIYAKKKLSLKNSALVCGRPDGHPFKRGSSIVFINCNVEGLGDVQALLAGAAVSRSFDFPEGLWYIPNKTTLKAKGKARLAFLGDMAAQGVLKGNITLNGEPVKAASAKQTSAKQVTDFVDIG